MSCWVQDSLRTFLHSKWQSVLKAEQLLHLAQSIWKPKETKLLETCSLYVWGFFLCFCLFIILKSFFILHMPGNWSCSSWLCSSLTKNLQPSLLVHLRMKKGAHSLSSSYCPVSLYYKKENLDNQVLNNHAKTHVIRRILHSCITSKALMTGNRLVWGGLQTSIPITISRTALLYLL